MAEFLDVTQLYNHFVSEGIHVHGAYMRILLVREPKARLHDNNIKIFLKWYSFKFLDKSRENNRSLHEQCLYTRLWSILWRNGGDL